MHKVKKLENAASRRNLAAGRGPEKQAELSKSNIKHVRIGTHGRYIFFNWQR